MSILRVSSAGEKIPYCPLCLELMEKHYDEKRRVFIYGCHADRVAIRCDDPFVNRWEQAKARAGAKFDCPNCGSAMRYFATATGFIKTLCPKKSCKMAMTLSEPDRTADDKTPENPGVLQ